jgi:glucose-6-phosphate isomerase
MQLPDEAITYQYQSLLLPTSEDWTPLTELRTKHLLPTSRLKTLMPQVMQVRSQVATERELLEPPPELRPLEGGFIDLPQKLLDQHRRKGDASELGRILNKASQLRELVDRILFLGIGGASLGARALFDALIHTYHNELPAKTRLNVPRIYFEGNHVDNDAVQDLLELLENSCIDPEVREERWGIVVTSKSGDALETAVAHRVLRNECTKYYGPHSELLRDVIVPITGPSGKLRELSRSYGYADDDILTIPENVGERFSVFTAAGLLPAAVMGLDVRAMLLGAAAMTRRFLEEPFERNPVLQYAAVNFLMTEEHGKSIRVLTLWSQKLEGVGRWHDALVAESLGKHGRGPTPLSLVQTRDLYSCGQLLQDGPRDKVFNHLVVKSPRTPVVQLGMSDHNQDELNALNRKSYPDLMSAAYRGSNQAWVDGARPTAEVLLPVISEHTMGQLMQMLMLATVVEARLMGVNPYSEGGREPYKRNMKQVLKG